MGQTLVTKSPSETQKWSERFAKKLRGGDVVALYGELGSGKTTFVRGLAKGLGVRRRIISPTFIIVRTYKIKNRAAGPRFAEGFGEASKASGDARQKSKIKMTTQNAKLFYHVDLYRVRDERELIGLGIEEILNDKEAVVAIEWAEKARPALPRKRYELYFDYIAENKRKVRVVSPDV